MTARRARAGRDLLAPTLRFAALLALVAVGYLIVRQSAIGSLLSEEGIAGLIREVRGRWWAPLALIGLYAGLAPLALPVGPLMIGGALFGSFYGALYNVAGLTVGALVSYGLARWLGRDFVLRVAGPRLRRAERLFARRGFWPLVQTRFLPLPFAVVNFGAALAGVKGSRFVAASVLGLVPSTVVHTVFISELLVADSGRRAPLLAAYAAAFVVLNAATAWPWVRELVRRRRRAPEARRSGGREGEAEAAAARRGRP